MVVSTEGLDREEAPFTTALYFLLMCLLCFVFLFTRVLSFKGYYVVGSQPKTFSFFFFNK